MHIPVLTEVPLPGRGEEYEYETEAGLSTEVKSGGPLLRETYRCIHSLEHSDERERTCGEANEECPGEERKFTATGEGIAGTSRR